MDCEWAKNIEQTEEQFSMRDEFSYCESLINQLGTEVNHSMLQGDLRRCIGKLERLGLEVDSLSLFSTNESCEELPTNSIKYFFIPYYLAMVYQTLRVEIEQRVDMLDKAKALLKDFLTKLKLYEVINWELPWTSCTNDEDLARIEPKNRELSDLAKERENKLRLYHQEKELMEKVETLRFEVNSNDNDESAKRDLLFARLRLAALKAMSDISQIDIERPLAEHMIKVRSGDAEQPKKSTQKSQKPFIITRDAAQKRVFGLGYPSAPTVTVDEWFDETFKHGRQNPPNGQSSGENAPGIEVSESDEEKEDQERRKLQRWDEYKDSHRRGWGNTKNKG